MPSAAAALAAQVAALAAVKEALGTSFIGFAIATTLYGITVLQTYLYFRSYRSDHWFLKSTVAVLLILDTLTTIFVAHSLYTSFILDFGGNLNLQFVIPWSFNAEKLLITLITFIVQCFYARILWKATENAAISIIVLIFALVTFGMGIYTSIHLFEHPLLSSVSERSFNIITGLVQGFASLDDVIITVAMCYYLHNKRVGFRKSSDKLIDNLILYAVSRGVITAVCQILFLILNVALPHHTYWQPFHQAVGKLYINSVLATLNVRHTLKEGTLKDAYFDSKGQEMVKPPQSSREQNTTRIQFHHTESRTSISSGTTRASQSDSDPEKGTRF